MFGTGQHESTSEGAGFSSYRLFTREARVVMLNIKLNINNFKSEQRQRESYQENVTEEGDYE
jgi:hypothetical protein